jgi:hypothetical protein
MEPVSPSVSKQQNTERSNGRSRVPGSTHPPNDSARAHGRTDDITRNPNRTAADCSRTSGPGTGARAGCHGAGPAFPPKHFRSDLSNQASTETLVPLRRGPHGSGHVRQRNVNGSGVASIGVGPPRPRPHGYVMCAIHFIFMAQICDTARRTGAAVTSSSSSSRH